MTVKFIPNIWLVIGDKPGDNAQIEIIAKALNLPFEIRRVIPKPEFALGKPTYKISLSHLDAEQSDSLEPPWPDLILTIGRRPSMAALWVQQQSNGHSKIILLGRPKRWMERFSLIIVPAQYRMPNHSKVLQLDLPLMRNNEAAIETARTSWREKLSALPQPLTALLIGGQTKPFRFNVQDALGLLDKATQAAGNGSLYISTSRRTPPGVVEALKKHLPNNATLFSWSPDNTDNPYLGLLGLADRFIVTGDSISMMVEVARLGKPLAIFELPVQTDFSTRLQQTMGKWLHHDQNGIQAGLGKLLFKLGLVRYSRDLTALHRSLYDKQLAVPLGKPFIETGNTPANELDQVTQRILTLVATLEQEE
ncbi:MAG: ELM1/GtrOC1 family putative glycosyltransferase [Gammaproteobacteria bacterium]